MVGDVHRMRPFVLGFAQLTVSKVRLERPTVRRKTGNGLIQSSPGYIQRYVGRQRLGARYGFIGAVRHAPTCGKGRKRQSTHCVLKQG